MIVALNFREPLGYMLFALEDLRNTNLYMTTSTRGFRCSASFGAR